MSVSARALGDFDPRRAGVDGGFETMADDRREVGTHGERAAERFLRQRRYTIVARNYRCPVGEVDLVALDGSTVVFVEVKTRRRDPVMRSVDAVDYRKQRQLVRVARYFIAQHRLEDRLARFDVVGVEWRGGEPVCELIQNAFDVEPSRR